MIHEQLADLVTGIDNVKPHPENPRDGDVGAIATSLDANGQYRPIVANLRNGYILAGNHTWRAAKGLGWDEIAVAWVDVDDDHERRIILADNRTSDLGQYDSEALAELLTGIAEHQGADALLGTGYDPDDLDQLLLDLENAEGTIFGNELASGHDDGPTSGADLDTQTADKVDEFDGDDVYESQYGVIVLCANETQQAKVYEDLVGQGYTVKVVVT